MTSDRQTAFNQRQLRLQADSDAIEEFKLVLIQDGFDILPNKKWQTAPYSYFSCHKNGKFLYIQRENLSATWTITSIYMPSKRHGTGIVLLNCDELTLDVVNNALSMKQSFNSDIHQLSDDAKFYRSLEHYISFHKNDFYQNTVEVG